MVGLHSTLVETVSTLTRGNVMRAAALIYYWQKSKDKVGPSMTNVCSCIYLLHAPSSDHFSFIQAVQKFLNCMKRECLVHAIVRVVAAMLWMQSTATLNARCY